MASAQSSISTIEQFIKSVGADTVKQADAPKSEAGSIGGETSHPVKSVDDRLKEVKEGERSAENAKDVKKDVPNSVDATPEASAKSAASVFDTLGRFAKAADGAVSSPGSAEEDSLQIGTKKAPTGEDPKSETQSAKAGKEDPGSSHPARTDNDSLDGHKYAFDENTPLDKLGSDLQTLGNDLCAALAWDAENAGAQKTAAAAQTQSGGKKTPPAQTAKQAVDLTPQLAHQLGWEMAGLVTDPSGLDKQAADAMVVATLEGVIKQASDDADNFIAYANTFFNKQAEGEEPPADAGGGEAGGGGAPAPGDGGAGGGEEDAMLAALGGGGGGDMGGGDMGGGGEIDVETILAVLQALGIDPSELPALAGGAGGAGGDPAAAAGGGEVPGADAAMAGMAGGGAGAPAPAPEMAGAGGPKMAADKVAKPTTKPAPVKKASQNMREFIAELVTRSKKG